jgi:hypothetical protein
MESHAFLRKIAVKQSSVLHCDEAKRVGFVETDEIRRDIGIRGVHQYERGILRLRAPNKTSRSMSGWTDETAAISTRW